MKATKVKSKDSKNSSEHKTFESLDKSYFFECDGPINVISQNPNGTSAIAFETKEIAAIFLKENADGFESRYKSIKKIKISPVIDGYKFMQACAKKGYAGIELFNNDTRISFVFCVTLENNSAALPNALAYFSESAFIIHASNKIYTEEQLTSIKYWTRFDILDRTTSQFSKNSPFSQGKEPLLYEIRSSENSFISVLNVPCRGHYNQQDGSIPFFTDLNAAIEYAENIQHRDCGEYGGFKTKFNKLANKAKIENGYKIVVIDNLKARLNEIKNLFIDFVINPNGTRDEMVYGTCFLDSDKSRYLLNGISGTWILEDHNKIKRQSDRECEPMNDTFYWNGFSRYKLNQLNKSNSTEAKPLKKTEQEVNEMIHQIFTDETSKVKTKRFSKKAKEINYYMTCWDAQTGEFIPKLCHFESFLSVIELFWQIECNEDFSFRKAKKEMHYSIDELYFCRPQKENASELTHEIIKSQLARIYKIAIIDGYKPILAEQLSSIVNSYFRTIQIDLLGYWKDLLEQSEGEDHKKLKKLFKSN